MSRVEASRSRGSRRESKSARGGPSFAPALTPSRMQPSVSSQPHLAHLFRPTTPYHHKDTLQHGSQLGYDRC